MEGIDIQALTEAVELEYELAKLLVPLGPESGVFPIRHVDFKVAIHRYREGLYVVSGRQINPRDQREVGHFVIAVTNQEYRVEGDISVAERFLTSFLAEVKEDKALEIA